MTRFYNSAVQLEDVELHIQSRGTLPQVRAVVGPPLQRGHSQQGTFSYCDYPFIVPFLVKRAALHGSAEEQMADEAHAAEMQGPHVRSNLTLKV